MGRCVSESRIHLFVALPLQEISLIVLSFMLFFFFLKRAVVRMNVTCHMDNTISGKVKVGAKAALACFPRFRKSK